MAWVYILVGTPPMADDVFGHIGIQLAGLYEDFFDAVGAQKELRAEYTWAKFYVLGPVKLTKSARNNLKVI